MGIKKNEIEAMRSEDSSLRGKVARLDWDEIPTQSLENDIKMIKQNDNLYGNTRMTDEQIVYFYIKHGGCAAAIKRELNFMSIQAIHNRLNDIGLPIMGKAGTRDVDVEARIKVFEEVIDKGSSYARVARKLGMSQYQVRAICKGIGVTAYGAIGMTNERFGAIFENCGRIRQRMADLIGVKRFIVDRKCQELGL